MRFKISFFAFVLGTCFAGAQGTFVYDQQSTGAVDGSALLTQAPFGQSFTPALDSIGFVEFQLFDGNSASTVAVNLRSGSITGPILGTSQSLTVPSVSSGTYDFLFANPVSLTPGTTYYLEPVIVSGGFAGSDFTFIQYPSGDAIYDGAPHNDRDFWFREGIISSVPEPSSTALCLVVGGVWFCHTRRKRFST